MEQPGTVCVKLCTCLPRAGEKGLSGRKACAPTPRIVAANPCKRPEDLYPFQDDPKNQRRSVQFRVLTNLHAVGTVCAASAIGKRKGVVSIEDKFTATAAGIEIFISLKWCLKMYPHQFPF